MSDLERGSRPRLGRASDTAAALLIVSALAASIVGCASRPYTTGPVASPPSVESTDTTSAGLKATLEARLAQRSELQGELKGIQTSLKAAAARYDEAKRSSDASTEGLRVKVQAKESELAKITDQLDTLDSEIEVLAERYNSSQASSGSAP